MSRRRARLAVYTAVALLAWGAISVMRPIPERRAGEVVSGERRPTWEERVDSLERGETLTHVLARGGLSGPDAASVLSAAQTLDPRRLPAGLRVTFGSTEGQSPSKIVLQLAIDRLLHLTKTDSGWVERDERLPWSTDTVAVQGEIASNLYDAFDAGASFLPAGTRASLTWEVADIFEYRLDMSRDLQPGDRFRVLFERSQGPQGAMRVDRILAVSYASRGTTIEAVRYASPEGRGQYYDQEGKSLRTMFLRAPVEFRRISSVFGMRKHPILGVWRAHKGTDYSASSGTPVRSIGDGVVVRAARMSGYGNVVDVRHPNGFVSRYGHLRSFARGLRRGSRVSISQTIGYVGMTGLATAPHLHFEVLVKGVQRNPRTALHNTSGRPLPSGERAGFQELRSRYLAMLERATTQLADSN
ncbi:MAG: M23 family metallopeptidase [Gemmatimonadaceae bacterium]